MNESDFETSLTEEHLTAIGAVVLNWTEVEYLIQSIIWDELDVVQSVGQAITTHLSLPMLMNILGSLLHLRFEEGESYQKFKRLRVTIEKVYGKRNDIVHSTWSEAEGGEFTLDIVKARGKLRIEPTPMRVSQIKAIFLEIDALLEELDDFVDSLA